MKIKAIFGVIGFSLLLAASKSALATQPLKVEPFNPGTNSIFAITSSLIVGDKSVALIDAQFQKNDAETLVKKIRATGKPLSLIYISYSDPDFYFGLDVIHKAFPHAKILATPPVIANINETKQIKVKYWGPKLGDNAPTSIIVPQPLKGDHFSIDGHEVYVKGLNGPTPARSYLWIPSIKTVVGGIPVESNMHVWVADTQSVQSRLDWIKTLNSIIALKPQHVIPGHYLPNADGSLPFTIASVEFTRDYLRTFDKEAKQSKNSTELISAMEKRYPDLAETDSLELSAKVIKGEMKWP